MVPLKYGFLVVRLLLTTAMIYLVVDGGYTLLLSRLEIPVMAPAREIRPGAAPEVSGMPLADRRAIIDRDLFHTRGGETEATPEMDIDALEETGLKLKLLGTIVADGSSAYAVIQSPAGQKQTLYRCGESVENAQIKMILREKVVLNVNGRDEILEMVKMDSLEGRFPQTGYRRPPEAVNAPMGAAAPETGPGAPGAANRFTLPRKRIEAALADQPAEGAKAPIKVEPSQEDALTGGLVITWLLPNSIYLREMGLRNGDILTRLDGRELSTLEDMALVYEAMRSDAFFSLEVKRREKTLILAYDVE